MFVPKGGESVPPPVQLTTSFRIVQFLFVGDVRACGESRADRYRSHMVKPCYETLLFVGAFRRQRLHETQPLLHRNICNWEFVLWNVLRKGE